MKTLALHSLIAVLCVFFTMTYTMDEQAIVPVKQKLDRKVPISDFIEYINRTVLYALRHETRFVHNFATQIRIPRVNIVRGDAADKDKKLVCHMPQTIQYLQASKRVIRNRDDSEDDHDSVRIDFAYSHEDTVFTREYFQHIRRMPDEGASVCFCNLLCGAGMLGILLILSFYR